MFEDVPKLVIYSAKDLAENMAKIKEIVANVANDWDKRVDSVSDGALSSDMATWRSLSRQKFNTTKWV